VRKGDTENRCLEYALQQPSGGTDYLVEKLLEDVRESPRRELLRRKLAGLRRNLRDLLAEALPEDNIAGNALLVRLAAWEQGLGARADKILAEQRKACVEVAETMAYLVRQFLRVDPAVLQPLPLHLHLKPDPDSYAGAYLAEQFNLWACDTLDPRLIDALGFDDSAAARRIRGDLSDSALQVELAGGGEETILAWLLNVMGGLTNHRDAADNRVLLAVRLEHSITGYAEWRGAHPDLTVWAKGGSPLAGLRRPVPKDLHKTIQYEGFIDPFLNHLRRRFQATALGLRGTQDGDPELVAMTSGFVAGNP